MVSCSPAVSKSCVSPHSDSFVSLPGWWCLPLRLFPSHVFPHTAIHVSPCLGGGVWLCGCFQVMCFPTQRFICLPVWVVVSGSPAVSKSCVSLHSDLFVSPSGWWCLPLRLFPSHVFSPHSDSFVSPSCEMNPPDHSDMSQRVASSVAPEVTAVGSA